METAPKISHKILNQIKERRAEVFNNEQARYQCAKVYRRRHYWLGIPTAVFTALVSSYLFYLLDNSSTNQAWKIAIASIGALAAILVNVQTFYQPSSIAEKHLDCGRNLYGLRLRIDDFLAKEDLVDNEEAIEFLRQTSIEMERISAGVPEIPERVWQKYCVVKASAA